MDEREVAVLFIAAEEAGHFILAYATGQEIEAVQLSVTGPAKVTVLFEPGLHGTKAAVALAGRVGVQTIFTKLGVVGAGLESQRDKIILDSDGGEDKSLQNYVEEALQDWKEEFLDAVALFRRIMLELPEGGSITLPGDKLLLVLGLRKKECGV